MSVENLRYGCVVSDLRERLLRIVIGHGVIAFDKIIGKEFSLGFFFFSNEHSLMQP